MATPLAATTVLLVNTKMEKVRQARKSMARDGALADPMFSKKGRQLVADTDAARFYHEAMRRHGGNSAYGSRTRALCSAPEDGSAAGIRV